MKKCKVILALILVAALCLALFAACSKPDTNPTKTDEPAKTDTAPAKTDTTPAKADTPDESEEEKTYSEDEYTDLVMNFFDLRMCAADNSQHIVDAINEYIGPKYGLQVSITYYTISDWMTKVQLAIGSGERIDVCELGFGNGVGTLYTNTMIMDITDYAAEYAPEAMELMGAYLDAYKYNGRLYGIPTNRGLCTNSYVIMRKDILEEVGMLEQGQKLHSWSGFEEILKAVAEKYKDTGFFALGNGAGSSNSPSYLFDGDEWSTLVQWDNLGDTTSMAMSDDAGHVSWYMDDPRYVDKLEMVVRWKEEGLLYPDSAIDTTHGDELMKQNVQFASIQESEYGVEAVKAANCGYELVCPMYAPGWITTGGLTKSGVGVPITAEEPEAACRFINVLYTDEYVMNLLIRGQEDVDYRLVDNQCVYDVKEKGAYYYEADFLCGNNLLIHPVEGQGADYFEQIKKINEAATVSPYLGFVFNNGDVQNLIANITAVSDQYSKDFACGNYTPEKLAEAKAKYESGGVHEYLDELQKQLDAWLASK